MLYWGRPTPQPPHTDLAQITAGTLLRFQRELERMQTEAQRLQVRLDAIFARSEDVQRICPVCGGKMTDLAPMLDLGAQLEQVAFHLQDITDPLRAIQREYTPPHDAAQVWGCEGCGGATSYAPEDSELTGCWSRGETQGQSLAALVFEHCPHVDRVGYLRDSRPEYSQWYLRAGRDWYKYRGAKDDVLERIGIA